MNDLGLLLEESSIESEGLYNRLISDKRFEVLIDENLLAFSKIKIASTLNIKSNY